ncbi:MAG: DNA polymerase I [Spirochaetia bacterium]
MPIKKATRYAAEDADITFRLYEKYSPMLQDAGLSELMITLEVPLIRVLGNMELEGIQCDAKVLQSYSKEIEGKLAEIEDRIYTECGEIFNINSTKQLQHILFTKRKLTPIRKTKTGYSTDTKVLEELSKEDVVPELILEHRGLSKLKSTYIDALPKIVNQETLRIHTHFIQTGTATGRLSSRDPNLQNIPVKDEDGRRIRNAFIPKKGWKFLSADYSQIELVILAHLSEDPELQKAFSEGIDVHKQTASLLFEKPLEEIEMQERRIAKTINFGIMYGMSGYRLSRELGIPRDKADSFIESYFQKYSGIKDFVDRTVEAAKESGKVSSILGRTRPVPRITSKNKTEQMSAQRIALNTPIQGSAADIVKLAMIELEKRLTQDGFAAKILLQIHDELVIEFPPEEEEALVQTVREIMEGVYSLSVPLRVNIESGSSWGAVH